MERKKKRLLAQIQTIIFFFKDSKDCACFGTENDAIFPFLVDKSDAFVASAFVM